MISVLLCGFAIVQLVQTFTANKHIEHLSVAEHETGRNLINLRQICNLWIQRLLVYLGLKWWISFVVAFPSNAVFLLFLVVLHGLYPTQHKRNANYKKGRGAPQNCPHLRRKEYFSNADWRIFLFDPKAFHINSCIFHYACLKRLGRLKWLPCFGRAVNDRHGFFQVRRVYCAQIYALKASCSIYSECFHDDVCLKIRRCSILQC